jgi:hypothetical protein
VGTISGPYTNPAITLYPFATWDNEYTKEISDLVFDMIGESYFIVGWDFYPPWDNDTNSDRRFKIGRIGADNIISYGPLYQDHDITYFRWGQLLVLDDTRAIKVQFEDIGGDEYDLGGMMVYFDITTLGEAGKAYGMSVGRGDGDMLYVTGCDDIELLLKTYSLPDFTLLNESSLGLATWDEITAGVVAAQPLGIEGVDLSCMVYGRMDDPLATGVVHLMYTLDGGVTFFEFEQGWANDICSACVEDASGYIYAIRKKFTGSDVYEGYESLTYRSSVWIQVQPRAIVWSYDEYLFLGAENAVNNIMVMYSPYPYTQWYDITENYPTPGGIRAVSIIDQ